MTQVINIASFKTHNYMSIYPDCIYVDCVHLDTGIRAIKISLVDLNTTLNDNVY